jgi:hypothetical protein
MGTEKIIGEMVDIYFSSTKVLWGKHHPHLMHQKAIHIFYALKKKVHSII